MRKGKKKVQVLRTEWDRRCQWAFPVTSRLSAVHGTTSSTSNVRNEDTPGWAHRPQKTSENQEGAHPDSHVPALLSSRCLSQVTREKRSHALGLW